MPPTPCQSCHAARALILRPKSNHKLCKTCFVSAFELEIHETITAHSLFRPGERVAIGASGGKDSTVLASVLKTLNERYSYGLQLLLLSIDEGITGYRDDSLETVKRNAVQYGMELVIVGYKELYGWTMDEVVGQVGKKGNCTYCGVFRRQALDRGAERMGISHVVTGHNADDVAETVLMNLLRGDLPRLSRATSIVTESASSPIKRSKPLKYAYEKEIVLYAHHKKLDYFTTECIYSPEAFRGSARALIKSLERIQPSSILDIVKSGEDMARCVPGYGDGTGIDRRGCLGNGRTMPRKIEMEGDELEGGCGNGSGSSTGGEMADMERALRQAEAVEERQTEITSTALISGGQQHDRDAVAAGKEQLNNEERPGSALESSSRKRSVVKSQRTLPKRQIGSCQRCGYMSSQAICQACMLLEGLNRSRPKTEVVLGNNEHSQQTLDELARRMPGVVLAGNPEG